MKMLARFGGNTVNNPCRIILGHLIDDEVLNKYSSFGTANFLNSNKVFQIYVELKNMFALISSCHAEFHFSHENQNSYILIK